MTNKKGDLRVLKAGVVYGPMSRTQLDQLLALRRIGLQDQISVRGAPWAPLDVYLGTSPGPSAVGSEPMPDRREAAPRHDLAVDGEPVLRLLSGNRIISSLSRAEVDQLRQAGRIQDDDLICALYGPWMCVGDFFAPPRSAPPATFLEEHRETNPGQTLPEPAAPSVPKSILTSVATTATPPTAAPATPRAGAAAKAPAGVVASNAATAGNTAPFAPVAILQPAAPVHPCPTAGAGTTGANMTDEWFVRVRGILSAPLRKQHVRALFDAREVTRDCTARHVSWPDNAWLPIHAIPQLADAVK